jgi:dihydroxyacetone kinase-like protein
MEQYILYAEVADYLRESGIEIQFSRVGNLFTSLEMMGVTVTLTKLDTKLSACLAYPCQSIGITVGDAS